MKHEIILAGYEAEAVPALALALAYGAMLEGKEVSWEPLPPIEHLEQERDYLIVIADEAGAKPGVSNFDALVALNQRAVRHYEDRVRSGGVIFYDVEHMVFGPSRTDVAAIGIPEAARGTRLGSIGAKELFFLGAIIGAFEMMSRDSAFQALAKLYPNSSSAERLFWREALEIGERQVIENSAALV